MNEQLLSSSHAPVYIAATVIAVLLAAGLLWLYKAYFRRRRGKAYASVAEELGGTVDKPEHWSDLPGFACPHGTRRLVWRERVYEHDSGKHLVTELRFSFATDDPSTLTALIVSSDYFDPSFDGFAGTNFDFSDPRLDDRFSCKSNCPTRLQQAMDDDFANALVDISDSFGGSPMAIKVDHEGVTISKMGVTGDVDSVRSHAERCSAIFDRLLKASGLA